MRLPILDLYLARVYTSSTLPPAPPEGMTHVSSSAVSLVTMRCASAPSWFGKEANLLVSCADCRHEALLNVDYLPDHVEIHSLNNRLICNECGSKNCSLMPN